MHEHKGKINNSVSPGQQTVSKMKLEEEFSRVENLQSTVISSQNENLGVLGR